MTEKKRDTSKKRDSIVDAALKAFEEQGYEKASMDYVAEVANASKRTVYNHFPSKESLFEEVFDRFLQESFTLKQIKYDPEKTVEEQLAEFAESKMVLANKPERLGLMRMAFAAFISHPELAQKAYAKAEAQEDSLSAWLKAASKDGRLDVKDPALAAEIFWSLFAGTFFWPPILQGPVEPKTARKLKKEFIETFLARFRSV
ncbi:MAG: TetR/AcrR family transcriptional regulator [Candidatus Thiodiazotropha lotti]|nr:TetR/AcrR family transcriptional regulator [Candidatus Thiodiazotropha lotti]MCG8001012.1 TetR/AcrR family transcriptional regulator [Candidatus Thiodiazotropha lotti]MCW4182659.1 TetR/AcrR family transcriptional regulator [Candidatus Thiodiazotropha weberae]MCW4192786.1 TetR/AcrR family transcriptional regulator [Candidatus Thiodiazotropha weberae]